MSIFHLPENTQPLYSTAPGSTYNPRVHGSCSLLPPGCVLRQRTRRMSTNPSSHLFQVVFQSSTAYPKTDLKTEGRSESQDSSRWRWQGCPFQMSSFSQRGKKEVGFTCKMLRAINLANPRWPQARGRHGHLGASCHDERAVQRHPCCEGGTAETGRTTARVFS